MRSRVACISYRCREGVTRAHLLRAFWGSGHRVNFIDEHCLEGAVTIASTSTRQVDQDTASCYITWTPCCGLYCFNIQSLRHVQHASWREDTFEHPSSVTE